jgi:hypothetical protein
MLPIFGPLKAVVQIRSGIAIGFGADAPQSLLVPADHLATALEYAGFKVETGRIPDIEQPDAVYVVLAGCGKTIFIHTETFRTLR